MLASTVKYITWKSVERRSVMASTADIQVNANRGRTTQELHREALSEEERQRRERRAKKEKEQEAQWKTRIASSGQSHISTSSLHTHTHTFVLSLT